MKAQDLIDSIKDIYLHQDDYSMQKYVPEFHHSGAFIGDYFNYFIFEPLGELPPRIYHIASPYDVISKKAPQQVLVFHDGKLELNIDFTEYVDMRTGIMDALLYQSLGITSLEGKRIILFGTGKIARWSLKYLKEIYPELQEIDVKNASGNTEEFIQFASDLGVTATYIQEPDLGQYDFIILHTNTNQPVLTKQDIPRIKQGAIISSYRTTSDSGELESEILNTGKVNVITDWEDSLSFVIDLKDATQQGYLHKDKVQYLNDLFQGKLPASDKSFTVFRSTGTPMQNIGILKLIMNEAMSG